MTIPWKETRNLNCPLHDIDAFFLHDLGIDVLEQSGILSLFVFESRVDT